MVFMGDMDGGIVRKLVRAKKFRLFLWAFLLQGWLDSIITPSPPSLLQSNIQVSHTFHPDVSVNSALVSHMTTQWGQFLDHDISRTPTEETEGCYLMPESENCFPIVIPRNDLFYLTLSTPQTCQKFSRSIAFCEDLSPVREQMNEWGGDWLVPPSTASKPCSSKNWWMATGFSSLTRTKQAALYQHNLRKSGKCEYQFFPTKKPPWKANLSNAAGDWVTFCARTQELQWWEETSFWMLPHQVKHSNPALKREPSALICLSKKALFAYYVLNT